MPLRFPTLFLLRRSASLFFIEKNLALSRRQIVFYVLRNKSAP
jgi:hypothetical protein